MPPPPSPGQRRNPLLPSPWAEGQGWPLRHCRTGERRHSGCWGSKPAGQDMHRPWAHLRGPPHVRGMGAAGPGRCPPVDEGCVATRSNGGPTPGLGMGDVCERSRILRLPGQPTVGNGILAIKRTSFSSN